MRSQVDVGKICFWISSCYEMICGIYRYWLRLLFASCRQQLRNHLRIHNGGINCETSDSDMKGLMSMMCH